MISNSRLIPQNIAFDKGMPPSTRVADTYSDDLMDDLFMDVDRILDGDLTSYMTVVGHQPKPITPSTRTVQLPSNFVPRSAADIYRATVEASYSSGGGRPVTAMRHAPAQASNFQTAIRPAPPEHLYESPVSYQTNPQTNLHGDSIQTVSNYLYPTNLQPALKLANVSPRPPQTIFEPQPQSQVSLPFLLVGAASISAVSTLGLWTLSQNAPSSGWLLSIGQEAAAAELPEQSDEDFLAYLQQSLNVIIARQDKANQTVAVIPVANQVPTLPTTIPNVNTASQLGALPNLPGAATAASKVIERVFVPVYPNAPQAASTPQNKAALPAIGVPNTLPNNNRAQRPTVPVPAPVAAAAALPPGAPATATPSVPIVQSGAAGRLPAPSAPIAVAPTNAAAAITDVTPNSEHVLVGILNLGSRSAALFNIDGSSQRAYVGDRVGVSDWTLVSVNGQDVVVRRNGEVRSVYIGQRF